MLVSALLVSAVLGFAALAKFLGPDPKKVLIGPETWTFSSRGLLQDYVVAASEVVVILLLLTFHRRRWVWGAVSLMFAGFAGYALYYLLRNESCGCFGILWVPPKGLTLGLDIAFAITGVTLASWKGAGRFKPTMTAITAALALVCSVTGFVFARNTAPPTSKEVIAKTEQENAGRNQFDMLLDSEMLADLKSDMSGVTHYIFVYSPDCHTCEGMKPTVESEGKQYEEQQDYVLRVRLLSIVDIEEKTKLESYYWSPTPTVFFVRLGEVIRDGEEVRRYNGDKAIYPSDEYEKLMSEFNQLVSDGKVKL